MLVAVTLLVGAAVASAMAIGQRRLEERYYLNNLEALLSRRFSKDGRWLLTDSEVEQALRTREAQDRTYAQLVRTHELGRPLFKVVYTDQAEFQAKVKFRWLLGGSYDITVRK